MTPLEKAVKAAHECGYDGCERPYIDPFNADDARAIIRAFLEAAAEDVAVKNAIGRFQLINHHDGWRLYESGKRIDGPWGKDEEEAAYEALDDAQAKAAILALKETING